MKNLFKNTLLFLAIFCFCMAVNGQTIRRVNNNPGVTGVNVYTTIQAAHDAAMAGDIVYVEPSNSSYGDLASTKQLTIIGNGYFISENISTTMPQDQRESKLGSINLNIGSASTKLIGISASNQMNVYVANVQIERCKLPFVNLGYSGAVNNIATSVADNVLIRSCWFIWLSGSSGFTPKIQGSSVPNGYISGNPVTRRITNATIINNIHTTGARFVGGIQNSLINNNTVNGGLSAVTNSSGEFTTESCIFTDNVVIEGSNSSVINSYNIACTYSNNVHLCSTCTGNHFPTVNGNQNNIAANIYFTASAYGAIDVDYKAIQLLTSPGLTAGLGGGQVGAFGGISPYKLAGLAPYPIITNFTTSGLGNPSTPLSVSVTVRGNN